jgi:flap endonuclease-1
MFEIGPKKAFDMIKKYDNIEGVLKNLDQKKYPVPEDWPYQVVREYFQKPEVTSAVDVTFKWEQPDEAGLLAYLVEVILHIYNDGISKQN